MGLPSSTQTDIGNVERRFSDDVFSVELSGPDHHHLSIVDVPGLFQSESSRDRSGLGCRLELSETDPTPTQTRDDLDTIRTMFESYMKDKRTIML